MFIANPIYDVVFKYLLDDEKVARLILSALLGETVGELHYRATEHRIPLRNAPITVLRLDFQAKIQLEDGSWKLVLIEIQKARSAWDMERFRRYLGSQYANPENTFVDAKGNKVPLPIISIYFLGENLDHTEATVVRVGRTYRDAVTGEEIKRPERFIESLTHDSIVVQIPQLKARRRNELEQLLSVFDQGRIGRDKHQLIFGEEEIPERHWEVIRRLQKAMAEPHVQEEMQIEDEILQAFLDIDKVMEEKDKALAVKDQALEIKDKALASMDKALESKDKALESKDKALESKDKALESKDKTIEDQARLIEELKQQLGKG